MEALSTVVEVVEGDNGMGYDRSQDLPVVPDGTYDVILTFIGDWTERNQTIRTLKAYDENHQKILDEDGNDIVLGENVPYTIVSNQIRVKIVGGEHDGRIVFGEISNYPNTPWVFSSFLRCFGGGQKELMPSEFHTLKGQQGRVAVKSRTYTQTVTDSDTGMETQINKTSNTIKSFYGA